MAKRLALICSIILKEWIISWIGRFPLPGRRRHNKQWLNALDNALQSCGLINWPNLSERLARGLALMMPLCKAERLSRLSLGLLQMLWPVNNTGLSGAKSATDVFVATWLMLFLMRKFLMRSKSRSKFFCRRLTLYQLMKRLSNEASLSRHIATS